MYGLREFGLASAEEDLMRNEPLRSGPIGWAMLKLEEQGASAEALAKQRRKVGGGWTWLRGSPCGEETREIDLGGRSCWRCQSIATCSVDR